MTRASSVRSSSSSNADSDASDDEGQIPALPDPVELHFFQLVDNNDDIPCIWHSSRGREFTDWFFSQVGPAINPAVTGGGHAASSPATGYHDAWIRITLMAIRNVPGQHGHTLHRFDFDASVGLEREVLIYRLLGDGTWGMSQMNQVEADILWVAWENRNVSPPQGTA